MVPDRVIQYLEQHHFPYARYTHRRAVPAQQLARALHVSGYQVAKTVVFQAERQPYLAVLPAPALVDLDRLGEVLDTDRLRLLAEDEFAPLFPGCEPGAEPPFGRLFRVPVLMDESLRGQERLIFRAGSHEEVLELRADDFERLERPGFARFAVLPETGRFVVEAHPVVTAG